MTMARSLPRTAVHPQPGNARPSGEARSATSHACSSGRPRRCRGTVCAAASPPLLGCFADRLVRKWPAAAATTAIPSPRQRSASSQVSPSTVARAALEWTIPASPWWGESVRLTIPPPAGFHRPFGGRLDHGQRAADVEPPDGPPALRGDPFRGNEVLAAGAVDQGCRGRDARAPSRRSASAPWRPRMSPATVEIAPPTSSAAASSPSGRRPAMTTRAPQRTSSAAVSLPSPVPPPVTSATRPASMSGAKMAEG